MMKYFAWIGCLIGFVFSVGAQNKVLCITDIILEGNNQTEKMVILGKMDIAIGDSLSFDDLAASLDRNKALIANTLLFTGIQINIYEWKGDNVILKIKVKEAWYIYPIPVFELADRNFNVWWVDFKRDWRRVNWGIWGIWRNPLGYNDDLLLIAQLGFMRKFELNYIRPPIHKNIPIGFGFNFLYSDNRSQVYDTQNNKPVFYQDFESKYRQFKRWRMRFRLDHRLSLFDEQHLNINYLALSISDSMVYYNPDYFLDANTKQKSFNIYYRFQHDERNVKVYPSQGYLLRMGLEKNGLGIFKDLNQWKLFGNFAYYQPFGKHKRWTASFLLKGQYVFNRKKQAYYNQRGLGYQTNYVRGFQYYVVDGQDYFFIWTDLNLKILDMEIPLWKKMPILYLQKMPIRLHLRYHFDLGQAWDTYYTQENPLNNKLLWGTGLGLDFIFYYYNAVLQLEYTFNNIKENALYLRYKFNF